MKYIAIFQEQNDEFTKEFETEAEAVNHLKKEYEHLSEYDKNRYKAVYVLKSINPDEYAVNHYDGDIVYKIK